jgi:hypothetical protein
MENFEKQIADCPDAFLPAIGSLLQLIGLLYHENSAPETLADAEIMIKNKGMELNRVLAQGFLELQRRLEEKRDRLVGSDGEVRTHRHVDKPRQIETLFGEVELRRIGYRGPGLNILYPLDAELNLPPGKYSQALRAEVGHLVAGQSFESSMDALRRQGGGFVPKRQMQEVVASLVRDFEAFYRQPLPPPEKQSEILVVTADGKGIAVHGQDLRPATRKAAEKAPKPGKRLRPGEKKTRKRMATVASVYETEPFRRTPEQLIGEDEAPPDPRPRPENKRTWAGIVPDMAEIVDRAFREALRRDPNRQKTWVVLIDGQPELIRAVEKSAAKHKVRVSVVQDFIHVTEYLWKAAHALHPNDPAKREEWVGERTLQILRGKARDVAAGLRRSATRQKLEGDARKPVETAAKYLQNNEKRLRYDEALAAGFPIATGVIEGACRHLVKDRMDLTGARWRLECAEAVLKLRSLKISGHLDQYLEFHFQREKERNYHKIN